MALPDQQAAPDQPDPGARGTSRRALLAGTVSGAAGLALGAALSPAAAAARTGTPDLAAGLTPGGTFPARPHQFVTTRGGNVLGGRHRVAVRRHQHATTCTSSRTT